MQSVLLSKFQLLELACEQCLHEKGYLTGTMSGLYHGGSGFVYVQLSTDIVNPIIEKGLKWTTRNKYEMLVYI